MKMGPLLTLLLLTTSALPTLAQMGGTMGNEPGRGGMGTHQGGQMMNGPMMSQEMRREMSQNMNQIREHMQTLSGTLEQKQAMDRTRTHQMAQVMEQMSKNMLEISQQTGKGQTDAVATKRLQEQTRQMNQMMTTLQKEKGSGSPSMDQDMTREMARTMTHLRDITQDMIRLMERDMDQTRTRDMTRLMDHMSLNLHEMSQQMDKGKMDPAVMKKMQERIREMTQTVETLQKVQP